MDIAGHGDVSLGFVLFCFLNGGTWFYSSLLFLVFKNYFMVRVFCVSLACIYVRAAHA